MKREINVEELINNHLDIIARLKAKRLPTKMDLKMIRNSQRKVKELRFGEIDQMAADTKEDLLDLGFRTGMKAAMELIKRELEGK